MSPGSSLEVEFQILSGGKWRVRVKAEWARPWGVAGEVSEADLADRA